MNQIPAGNFVENPVRFLNFFSQYDFLLQYGLFIFKGKYLISQERHTKTKLAKYAVDNGPLFGIY